MTVGPELEPEGKWRVPSRYPRCRRAHCPEPPVADMRRGRFNYRTWQEFEVWYAYCAAHLRVYNCEVRDGQVWWLGINKAGGLVGREEE